ncbi:hypothetical protein MLC59_10595 [Marinobacter bryozoorum]|uniref:hypothetical protein n=1 Tax=Marinobacter bryozoorum TaxID=256324 RepID=UPI0020040A35|nr:hypothetical protein [Marinobacter bryozoorum]MCK7544616.1 hypothetical protein [Marinobacter bryozoorum]
MKNNLQDHTSRLATLPLACFFILSLIVPALVQAAPLTEQRVQSFIETMEDTESLEDEFPELAEMDDNEVEDMSQIFTSSVQKLDKHPEALERLNELTQQYGFSNARDWADTGDRIFSAMMAINLQEMPANQRARMEQQSSPENMPRNLSEAQKAEIQQMFSAMQSMLKAAENAPQSDIDAVRPHMDQLKSM